jgi:SNF2 family DNA or RNA helicase
VNAIQKGKETGITKLKSLVQAISLRRTKESILGELNLGARIERLQSVELNDEERDLYSIVKKTGSHGIDSSTSMRSIFQTILKLRQICNHGRELLPPEILRLSDSAPSKRGSFVATSGDFQYCENCGQLIRDSTSDAIAESLLSCFHLICQICLSKDQEEGNAEEQVCPICLGTVSATEDEQSEQPSEDAMNIDFAYNPSSKVRALLQNLRVDQSGSGKYPIKR